MTIWHLEPRDTLVLRDGRPMRGTKLQMKSLPLPFPSAIAGFFRTRSATDGEGRFKHAGDTEACRKLLELKVRGPWLVELTATGSVPLLPAPRDALQLEEGKLSRLGRLPPLSDGEETDLRTEESLTAEERQHLSLIGPPRAIKSKPTRNPVPLWRWSQLEAWLIDPNAFPQPVEPRKLGMSYPAVEPRTHVKINPETLTGEDGALFSVEHRRYQQYLPTAEESPFDRLSNTRRLAIAAACDASSIQPGAVPFAGERRLVRLRAATESSPALPAAVRDRVIRERRARIICVTPAAFTRGWKPTWLLEANPGLTVSLAGACVPRPEVVSGWDLVAGKPKPTRRLVPAGSVYFVRLDGDDASIGSWVDELWWRCVSDDQQARRDGFGLCVIGTDPDLSSEVR